MWYNTKTDSLEEVTPVHFQSNLCLYANPYTHAHTHTHTHVLALKAELVGGQLNFLKF